MSTPRDYDRLAARLRGTASAAELEDLDRCLAVDAELARRARDLETTWVLTRVLDEAPSSTTTFVELLARGRRARRTQLVRRAAAALLVLAPLGYAAWVLVNPARDRYTPERVTRPIDTLVLEHVPLEERVAPVDEALGDRELAMLADYAPTKGETIQFLTSLEDARVVSAATGRPLFVFGYVSGCPWCTELRGTTFAEPRLRALVARAVPVAIDLLASGEDVSAPLFERGYPAIELQDRHGAVLEVLSGPPGTVDLGAGLERALEAEERQTPALDWAAMNDLARILVKSSFDERQGRYSTAWNGFADVAESVRVGAMASCAEAGRVRIADAARRSMLNARDAFGREAREGVDVLRAASGSFSGTPFAVDFDGALAFVNENGAFPRLVARSE